MAGQAASEIRVGANGTIYIAPSGTTPPVDITSPWTSFVNIGFATEDGAKLARSMDTNMVKGWQSISVLRYLITGVGLTTSFTLLQSDKDILPLYFGGGSVVTQGAGKYKFDISSAPTVDERVFGLEWVDGALTYRFVMPRCMVTDTGETTIGRNDAIQWPFTISAMSPVSGTVLGTILTNDAAFA
jgi:hypothetical protein